jgi:hypothetical protein
MILDWLISAKARFQGGVILETWIELESRIASLSTGSCRSAQL